MPLRLTGPDTAMITSYFFMKVGYANCLLSHAVHAADTEGRAVLWVGFNDQAVPLLEPNVKATGSLDLLRMARASWDGEARASARVLTFHEESLYVWRIIERLRPISAAEVESLVARYAADVAVHTRFECARGDLDALRAKLRSKALPVRLEAVIRRALLPACVDSLSVYQSLNRGTFRFLGPTTGPVLDGERLAILEPEPVPLLLPREKAWRETPFACFVRKYLDWCLDPLQFGSFAQLHELSQDDVFTLATTVMSPSQLEVAAAVLVQSLGLTLDAGVGKGLDVVDVRASLRHRKRTPGYRALLDRIASTLEGLMGIPLAPAVLEGLRETGSLELQCKNYEVAPEAFEHPTLVLFAPSGRSNGRSITLAGVRGLLRTHPGSLPVFEDWLDLLESAYTEPRETSGFVSAAEPQRQGLTGARG